MFEDRNKDRGGHSGVSKSLTSVVSNRERQTGTMDHISLVGSIDKVLMTYVKCLSVWGSSRRRVFAERRSSVKVMTPKCRNLDKRSQESMYLFI